MSCGTCAQVDGRFRKNKIFSTAISTLTLAAGTSALLLDGFSRKHTEKIFAGKIAQKKLNTQSGSWQTHAKHMYAFAEKFYHGSRWRHHFSKGKCYELLECLVTASKLNLARQLAKTVQKLFFKRLFTASAAS